MQISAFAPFSLNRDRSRAVQVIDNWSGQSLAQGWEVKSDHGRRVLVETGDQSARPQPLELPDLSGHYAVFGTATSAFLLRLSIDGVVREVVEAQEEEFGRTFITATDLSAARAELVPTGTTGEGISELHFVPVTAKSIQKFRQTVENPQVALRGVLDWHESCRLPLGNEPGQAVADYVDAEMHVGSRELGMQTFDQSLLKLIKSDMISLKDALKVCNHPDDCFATRFVTKLHVILAIDHIWIFCFNGINAQVNHR